MAEIKIPISCDLLLLNNLSQNYIMNAIVNQILLAGDKFMPEMHLKLPGLKDSTCDPFTKNKERIK